MNEIALLSSVGDDLANAVQWAFVLGMGAGALLGPIPWRLYDNWQMSREDAAWRRAAQGAGK